MADSASRTTSGSAPAPGRPLRVAITGASGLVGSALGPALAARGHEVRGLTRSAGRSESPRGVRWVENDPLDAKSVATAIEGVDAVVNLAGHNLFQGRWNDERKEGMRRSRVDTTRALVDAMASMAHKPKVLVSASAVGWYGPLDPDQTVDERATTPGNDFLAQLCAAWEVEARRAESIGVRTVVARFGVVLSREGGALQQMALPFRLFVGGPIGSGRQVVSWIHLDDLVALLVAAVEVPAWSGVVNVCAPFPVSSKEFAKALGHALHRPSFVPTPAFALRVVLGEVASVVTTGQRALPTVAASHGFVFRYPTITEALADLCR